MKGLAADNNSHILRKIKMLKQVITQVHASPLARIALWVDSPLARIAIGLRWMVVSLFYSMPNRQLPLMNDCSGSEH